MASEIERQIISHVITSALSQGYLVSVYSDRHLSDVTLELAHSDDITTILEHMFSSDEDVLTFHHKHEPHQKPLPAVCWVHFIHGNDCDVLSDYVVNADSTKILKDTDEFIDRLVCAD